MYKASVPGTGMYNQTYSDSRGPTRNLIVVLKQVCKRTRWYLSHCAPERKCLPTRTQIKNHHGSADERILGKLLYCSFYLINLFPWILNPLSTFFLSSKLLAYLLLIKKVSSRWRCKTDFLGYVTCHLIRLLAIWIKPHKELIFVSTY